MLAVAGDSGVSREKVAALLWPESDMERARASITQALYATRRALSSDDLFLTGGPLRLNPARLSSDVQEVEGAIAQGEWRRAVDLYRGPFLDGFSLPGCAEFEHWAMAQRSRVEDHVVTALSQLIRAAEAARHVGTEVELWKQLATIRPLDSGTAVGLMDSLARAGDRAGAIRHGQIHETLLRAELDLGPDPAVVATVERLRGSVVASAPVVEAGAAPSSVNATPHAIGGALATEKANDRTLAPPPPPTAAPPPMTAARGSTRHMRRSSSFVWPWVAAGMMAMLTYALMRGRRGDAAAETPAVSEVSLQSDVVVAPFRVSGASASLAYLREGIVELLSERLSDDSAARSVDAGVVLSAWHRAEIGPAREVPRDSALRLAASLGARRLVIGSVVGTPARAIVNATVLAVPDGRTLGTTRVEGPTDSLTTLIDGLAGRLLMQEAGEPPNLAGVTTSSLTALRAYLAGQASFRRGAYDSALLAYTRALEEDSTFALAALQLVRASDRLQSSAARTTALARAWRARDTFGAWDRALLTALAGPRYPEPSHASAQLAAWERLVALTPDRADAWYELGARLFHSGRVLGIHDARQRSASALIRSLALDSTYLPSRRLLVLLATEQPTETQATTAADLRGDRGTPAIDLADPLSPFLSWRVATRTRDSSTVAALRDSMDRLGSANLLVIAQSSQFDAIDLLDAERALRILRNRPGRPTERLEQALAEHSLALVEGRTTAARAAVARLEDLQPGTQAAMRLLVLDALYGDGDLESARRAARQLELALRTPDVAPSSPSRRDSNACVLAQWQLTSGDTTSARQLISRMSVGSVTPEDLVAPTLGAVGSTPSGACRPLLNAWLAVATNQDDARAAVTQLDSIALIPPVAGDASAYAHLLIGRLHARLGDLDAAYAAVRRRVYLMGWPRYVATALREEAQYAELLGLRVEATSALERYLVLRSRPDSVTRPQVDAARRTLDALRAVPAVAH